MYTNISFMKHKCVCFLIFTKFVYFRFNVLTRQWTILSQMNTPRAWPGVAIFDSRIYVLGGFDGGYRLRSGECYDMENDNWSFINNMLVSRAGCGAAVV